MKVFMAVVRSIVAFVLTVGTMMFTPSHAASLKKLHTIHIFEGQVNGDTDGFGPIGGLTLVRGVLFGVTYGGGDYLSGTLFRINQDGTDYHIVHHFHGLQKGSLIDGSDPQAGLTLVGRTLYGTTAAGGTNDQGSVFAYTPGVDAAPRVLHSFSGGSDGALPMASVINVGGVLYGTTQTGGSPGCFDHDGCGTVFSLDTATGAYQVLHDFHGGKLDGQAPLAPVTFYDGAIYGTTSAGGGAKCFAAEGCGIVFEISLSTRAYTQVHRFRGGVNDGAVPSSGLTVSDGLLYGSTQQGGEGNCGLDGCGTVFSVTPAAVGSGKPPLSIVFNQFGGSNGVTPGGSLLPVSLSTQAVGHDDGPYLSVHHGFVGITFNGGSPGSHGKDAAMEGRSCSLCPCSYEHASGTVFEVKPMPGQPSQFTLASLYAFDGKHDGALPAGALIERGGILFGEALQGGKCQSGTLFALPAPADVPQ